MWLFNVIIYIFLLICCAICSTEVSDLLTICHKNDPELTSCMINSVERLRPHLKNGIPSLNIPSIEPLAIDDLTVSDTGGLKIALKDIKAYKPSNFKIKSLNVVTYGKVYTFEVFFANLNVDGMYDINGQILLFPIRGTGPFTSNFTNCEATVKAVLEELNDNGEEHVHIKSIEIKVKIGRGKIKLQNLFNGDRVLGDSINQVINQNFDFISKEVIPLIERSLQKRMRKFGNLIVNKFTFDQLFPL